MGSKDDISKPTTPKTGSKPRRKSGPVRRRTRMFALEPRVLFDGALVADIVAEAGKVADAGSAESQASQAAQADTSAKAAAVPGANEPVSVVPATVEVPGAAPVPGIVVQAADRDTSKPGVDAGKPAATASNSSEFDRVSDASAATVTRHEIVFVDAGVQDVQTLLSQINNPDARVVMLDTNSDALDQMANYLDGKSGIDAIHIISHGSAGNLILAGQTYSADTLSAQYAVDMARIGHALTADGDILLYGCDIGKGSAGEHFIEKVAEMTGADIAASLVQTSLNSRLPSGRYSLVRQVQDAAGTRGVAAYTAPAPTATGML